MILHDLLAIETRHEAKRFRQAALLAGLVGGATVLLLGLSGWFITGAALAGLAGPIAAQGFNYLLPSAGIRLLAILRTGARYGERLAGHAASLRAMARVRGHLFLRLARGPNSLAIGSGEAAGRMVQDVTAIEGRLVRRSGCWGLATSTISGGLLIGLAGWMAIVSTLCCLIVLLTLSTWVARRSDRLARTVQIETGLLKQEFAELAAARPELRCYGLDGWAAERVSERGYVFGRAQRRLTAVGGLYEAALAFTLALAAVGALALAAHAGAAIAALAALTAAMTIDGAAPFVRDVAARGSVRAAEVRLDALLSEQVPEVLGHETPTPRPRLALGSRTGIIGASGCGKTIFVECLVGHRPLDPGFVTLGGCDLSAWPSAERRALFAWCPQDAMLVTGTVRDNLLLAHPCAGDAMLWSALHDAALDARILELGGLDLWIGEDGVRLSGGERRRLALARALLADAPMLVLDEPTEGLDGATEALVVERLRSRLHRTGQGLLLVSHRPLPLRLCDTMTEFNPERLAA